MDFGKSVRIIFAIAIVLLTLNAVFGAETCAEKFQGLQQNGGSRLIGGYVPKCDENGNYKPKQFWGGIGYSFCVNSTTGEQTSPSVRPWLFNLTCHPDPGYPNQSPFNQFPYNQKCSTATANAVSMPGAFVAQCSENGDFRSMQCWGSTGQCWCVNATSGIPYSELTRNMTNLHCAAQNNEN